MGMLRSRWDEIRIAGLHRNGRQQIFHGVVRKGPEKLLLVHAPGFSPKRIFRAALRPDQMPHLGFSAGRRLPARALRA